MNVNSSIQPSQQPSQQHPSIGITGTPLAAESAGREVSQYAQENLLRKDIELFIKAAGRRILDRNIMLSPLLVSATEKVTAEVINAIRNDQDTSQEANQSDIHSTAKGIHVLSKRDYVDALLKRLQEKLKIPYTTSDELLDGKACDSIISQLNDSIAKDTNGMITNMLSPVPLKDPNLAFQLVTWLFKHVTWEEPFRLMDKCESSYLDWNGQKQPKIDWMTSVITTGVIQTKVNGFDFIGIPVKESGLHALLVMPPMQQPEGTEDQIVNILSEGILSLLKGGKITEQELFLPKYKFDYEYITNYPELRATGNHRAALDINERGAAVGAASSMLACDGINSKLYINRPFYFAMVNQPTPGEYRMAGMAYINKPWND